MQQARQPRGRALADETPAALQARLRAVLGRLGRKPNSLDGYKASWAALDLLRNLRSFGPVTDAEPLGTLERLAKERHVPVKPSARYDALPMLKEFATLPEEQGLILLDRAVSAAEHQLERAQAIGRAWARGNLKVLREEEGPSARLSSLLKAAPAAQTIAARADEDIVAAIDAALALPGSSVAEFDLNSFARRGEAIEKLRAQGVEITEPAD